MTVSVKVYTTTDAIEDFKLWKSGETLSEEFYRCAPRASPGNVIDYDYTVHNKALKRLQRMKPLDYLGAILMIESVIIEIQEEGARPSVKGLEYLQKILASHVKRETLSAVNLLKLARSKTQLKRLQKSFSENSP